MEGPEVPLEHLHEEIHHHAAHGGWISGVALSTAVLAVLAAIAGLLAGSHANEAMMSQIEASDQWGYYQAKSIKAAVLEAKTTLSASVNEADRAKTEKYPRGGSRDQARGGTQADGGEGIVSQTRNLRARGHDVPNCDRDRGHLGFDEAEAFLGGQHGFRRGRYRLSRPGLDGALEDRGLQRECAR